MTKTEQVLIEYKKGFTTEEIVGITGLPSSTVRWAINSNGFKANKKSPGLSLDHTFQEFILGSVLGDGSIGKDNRLSVAHCLEQEEYIKYKYDFVSSYQLAGTLTYNKTVNDRYKNGFTEERRFRTLTSDKMSGMRDFYYPNEIKSVPKEEFLFEFLSPLAIAIWYQDDGNISNYGFQLNTQSFSIAECNSLRYVLLAKYGIESSLAKSDNIINISAKSVNTFTSLISEFVHPTMTYKLTPRRRVLDKLGELQERCDANLQPSLDSNIFEGSTTNDRVL